MEKKNGQFSYPWQKIKSDYLQGATLNELVARYDVKKNTLKARIYRDKWKESKDKIYATTDEKVATKIEKTQIDRIERITNVSEKFIAVFDEFFATDSHKNKDGKIDPAKLDALTNAMRKINDIIRLNEGRDKKNVNQDVLDKFMNGQDIFREPENEDSVQGLQDLYEQSKDSTS